MNTAGKKEAQILSNNFSIMSKDTRLKAQKSQVFKSLIFA